MAGLDPDAYLDRRRLKRRVSLWRALALLALMLATAVALQDSFDLVSRPHVARVTVSGVILDDPARDRAIRRLAEDDAVEAVLLRIDSPGGTVGGGEALYRALVDLAEKKPVVAVMASLATSAAYMAALPAERIVARESTITGSIGVIMHATSVAGLLDKVGIQAEAVRSRPLKGAPDPLTPITAEALAATEAVVLDVYGLFVDLVVRHRKLDRGRVLELADGRIYTGRQALAAGLVDATGGEEAARAWLAETHAVPRDLRVRDVEVSRQPDAGGILGRIQKALFHESLTLDGLVAVWHPSLR